MNEKIDYQPDYPPDTPNAKLKEVPRNEVVPEDFYSSSNFPTHIKYNDRWYYVADQRMDCAIKYYKDQDCFRCLEIRKVKKGDLVLAGAEEVTAKKLHAGKLRKEKPPMSPVFVDDLWEEKTPSGTEKAKKRGYKEVEDEEAAFEFMKTEVSRERPILYAEGPAGMRLADMLYQHKHEGAEMPYFRSKRPGFIIWVLGPAVIHTGAMKSMEWIIEKGYCDVLFTGNAVAVHDIEAQLFNTSLGRYVDGEKKGKKHESTESHKHHMYAIAKIKDAGSIEEAIKRHNIKHGIMHACITKGVPFVLAGSIRDDGPLPEVITDICEAQDEMRKYTKKATLAVMVATALHSIATGNMLPATAATICVDQDEFIVSKLKDRGTHQALGVVTNAQDFFARLVTELEKLEKN